MTSESVATRWCVRELVQVRELASSHRLEKMRRVRMLEMQEAWKREGCFDGIEIIAEMHAQILRRLRVNFDSGPLYYTGLYNS